MHGKKNAIARIAASVGLTRLAEAAANRPHLLVLNYHRIGEAFDTPYDPGNFSCTCEDFDWQLQYSKSHYDILTLPEALRVVSGHTILARPSMLFTFDDGYIDNYQNAFPLLKRHGVPASFFLPTAFIGSSILPWWDEIAFILKNSPKQEITLTYPQQASFNLSAATLRHTISAILELYKRPSMRDAERFLVEMEAACGCLRPQSPQPLQERSFINWDEAREMQASGMSFGSHTHSHRILGKLPLDQQIEELRLSRQIIERELGTTIDTLAYPVGHRGSFSPETITAATQTGYRYAFSFYSGVNRIGSMNPLNILRTGVHSEPKPRFRLRTALQLLAGYSPI